MDRTGCRCFFLSRKYGPRCHWQTFGFSRFFFVVDFLTKKEKASWQAGRSSWSFFGSLAARGSHFTFTSSLCVSLTSWSQVYDFFVIGSSHKSHSHGTGLWHWDEERRFGNPASTAKESTLLRWNRVARRRKFQGSERLLGGFQRYHWDHSGPKKENQLLPKPSENAYKVKEADFASDLYKLRMSLWCCDVFFLLSAVWRWKATGRMDELQRSVRGP